MRRFAKALPTVPTAFLVTATHPNWCRPLFLKALGARAIHPEAAMLLQHEGVAKRLRDFSINTWTVNSPDDAKRLRELGVRGIISDNPGVIVEALATR